MCMWVGYNPWIIIIIIFFFFFFSFFPLFELCYFLTLDCMKVYRQWVPCKCNSLYNFILIVMQLCTFFFHGLKMCILFGVNFCHFSTLLTLSFSQVRHQLHRSSIYILVAPALACWAGTFWPLCGQFVCTLVMFGPLCELNHFSTSMYRKWVPCERNSSYNFISICLKLCRCFLHGLKMCIWFGCNPCVNFCHFFHFANFVIFWPQILWRCCDSGYLVSATPHTILYRFFLNLHMFSPWS